MPPQNMWRTTRKKGVWLIWARGVKNPIFCGRHKWMALSTPKDQGRCPLRTNNITMTAVGLRQFRHSKRPFLLLSRFSVIVRSLTFAIREGSSLSFYNFYKLAPDLFPY